MKTTPEQRAEYANLTKEMIIKAMSEILIPQPGDVSIYSLDETYYRIKGFLGTIRKEDWHQAIEKANESASDYSKLKNTGGGCYIIRHFGMFGGCEVVD